VTNLELNFGERQDREVSFSTTSSTCQGKAGRGRGGRAIVKRYAAFRIRGQNLFGTLEGDCGSVVMNLELNFGEQRDRKVSFSTTPSTCQGKPGRGGGGRATSRDYAAI
jgi:hypothetical protein